MIFCVFFAYKNFLVSIQIRKWHTLKIQIQVETKFEWPKYDSTEKFVKFCPNKKNNKVEIILEESYSWVPNKQVLD
jgi:hypothetical protein